MTVKLKGDINALFKKLHKMQNVTPLLDAIKQKLLNDVKLGFRQGRDPDGLPWAAIKHRIGQPLRDTGRLNRSITAALTGKKITIGTNVEYAALHQFGGKQTVSVPAHIKTITQAFGKKLKFPVHVNVSSHTKKQNVKARPFLGLGIRQHNMISNLFIKWGEE